MGLYPPEGNSVFLAKKIEPEWPHVKRREPCSCSAYARLHVMAATSSGNLIWICASCRRVTARREGEMAEPEIQS